MTNRSPFTAHTAWCGRGHHCGLDEHRSTPITWTTPYGAVVATLTQHTHARSAYLELRIRVRIASNETTARRQAADIATDIDTAIRRITRRYIVRQVTR
jgi:hypothetical protein